MKKGERGQLSVALGMGPGDLRFASGYFFMFAIYGVSGPFLQVLLAGLGYGSAEVGLYQGLFEVVGIGGPLILARLADRKGAYKPFLFAAALMAALAALPLGIFHSPFATLPAMAVVALGLRGMVPMMDASVVGHTIKSLAAKGGPRRGYGVIRSVGTMGFIVMLGITQVAHLERASPFTISAWLAGTALVFALALLVLPESGQGPAPPIRANAKGKAGLDPILALGLVIIVLGRLSLAPINAFFTLYVTDFLHSDMASSLWAVAALAEIPALIISGKVIERFGAMRVIAFASGAIALRLAIYALVPTIGGVIVAQMLHFFCYGLFLPAAISFVSSRVPVERRAFGMALLTSVGIGLPSFLGSTFGGLILEYSSYPALFAWSTIPALLAIAIWALTARRFER